VYLEWNLINLIESCASYCNNFITILFIYSITLSDRASPQTRLLPMLRVRLNNISTWWIWASAWWIEWLSSNLGSRLKLNRSFISNWCHLTLKKWSPQVRVETTTSGKVPKAVSDLKAEVRERKKLQALQKSFHNVVLTYVLCAY